MSNILDFQVSRAKPSVVGGTGSFPTVKYFPRPLGTSLATQQIGPLSSTFVSQATTPNATNPTGALWIPIGPQFDGQQFDVLVSGTFGSDTGDPSGTVNVQLQAVTGTFANPVYTTICSTGTLVPTYPAAEPWGLTGILQGDDVSGFLQGAYQVYAGGALTKSFTPLDNILTGLSFSSGNPALQRGAVFGLVVGVTFGTSNTTNTASLTQFTVES